MSVNEAKELVESLVRTLDAARPITATITPALEATLPSGSRPPSGDLAPDSNTTLPTLPTLELIARDAPDANGAELTVLGVLGEGGMGRVLVARQRSLAREVAIKVLKTATAGPNAAAALLAEARITGHLAHPNIVPIHALGRDAAGNPVLVMKRIDGVVWTDLLDDPQHHGWEKMGWVSAQRRTAHLELFVAVCNAVHFAHSRGIVHRDLKPDNVMLGEFGEVYVTDWGIALTTSAATSQPQPTLVGTPAYMAPEMARCELAHVDARTDVYLLGALLHQILTGTHRNRGTTLPEVLQAALTPEAVAYDPSVPEELAQIANKATHADREQRFQTALELQRAIADHLRHLGSIELAEVAARTLDELRKHLALPGADALAERLAAECRFGFQHALRTWPENPAALRGLDACLEVIATDKIARGDALGARALVTELRAPPADLIARLEALEKSLAAKGQQLANLEAMAKDLDPRVASRARFAFLIAGLVINSIAAIVLINPTLLGLSEVSRLVLMPVVFVGLGLVLWVFARRRLVTTFNRRGAGLVLLGFIMVFFHRGLSFLQGEPLRPVLRGDLLLIATLLLAAAIVQQRAVAFAAIPFLAAAVFLPTDDHAQLVVFGIAATVGMLMSALLSAFTSPNDGK